MRNYIILAMAGIAGSILAYYFGDHLTGPAQHGMVVAEVETQRQADIGSVSDIQDKIDQLASAFQRFQETHQEQRHHTEHKLDQLASSFQQFQETHREQRQHAQREQARLNDMLVDLNNELVDMETTRLEPSDLDPIPREGAEIVVLGDIPEEDFGQWMNETLQNAAWDFDITSQINEQANETLASLPGVSLDDMQCSERFCRATLSHESGELPDTSKLMGKPPFTNDAFTVHGEDGRVTLYFTGPGVTLADLQTESQQTMQ